MKAFLRIFPNFNLITCKSTIKSIYQYTDYFLNFKLPILFFLTRTHGAMCLDQVEIIDHYMVIHTYMYIKQGML